MILLINEIDRYVGGKCNKTLLLGNNIIIRFKSVFTLEKKTMNFKIISI